MLDVIHTRGLPLDRITTTDVWATDTIPAWLPPMQEFRDRMDDWIWTKYRIECEHLCAMNKDGTKKTYEQMFYHVPKRRSQYVQVERRIGSDFTSKASRCMECRGVNRLSNDLPNTGCRGRLLGFLQTPDTTAARNSKLSGMHIKGFPLATGITWCQNLKTRAKTPRLPSADLQLVQKNSKSTSSERPFRKSAARGAEKQISWNIWALLLMSRIAMVS